MGVTHLRAYLANPWHAWSRCATPCACRVNGVLAGVSGNSTKSDNIDLGLDVKVYRTTEDRCECRTDGLLHADAAARRASHRSAALHAGKHVICEKPLARTSAEACGILEVAANSPGILMPAMSMRFWPGWNWLKQVVEEQTYGKVLAARFRRDARVEPARHLLR